MRYEAARSSIVQTAPYSYVLKLYNEADNKDPSLPEGFRRWWHVKVDELQCQQACKVSDPSSIFLPFFLSLSSVFCFLSFLLFLSFLFFLFNRFFSFLFVSFLFSFHFFFFFFSCTKMHDTKVRPNKTNKPLTSLSLFPLSCVCLT